MFLNRYFLLGILRKLQNKSTIFYLLLFTFQQFGFTQKDNVLTINSENTFKDTRDGQTYKTVTFNNDLGLGIKKTQTWLAENLRYEIRNSSWWYDNEGKTNRKYGFLYTWEAAKIACPKGWRLPTDVDWQVLMHQVNKGGMALGGSKVAYKILLEGGSSGFAALLGGKRTPDEKYFDLNKNGSYWSSSTNLNRDYAWNYYLNSEDGKVIRYKHTKTHALSCRCLKD